MATRLSDTIQYSTRLPRYAGEKPLPDRTQANDQAALHIAELALKMKERRRRKSAGKNVGGSEDKAVHDDEEDLKRNTDASLHMSSIQVEPQDNHETLYQETSDHAAEHTSDRHHQVFGDVPEVRLPLKSMYDGTGDWPKRVPAGGIQYSWSGIGFPKDKTLVVGRYEEDTIIDHTEASFMEFSSDIADIHKKAAEEIADGIV